MSQPDPKSAHAQSKGELRESEASPPGQRPNRAFVLKFQRDLLRYIEKHGSATTDDVSGNLLNSFAGSEGNYRGWAVSRLAIEGVIVATKDYEPCRRKRRIGSPIKRWRAVNIDVLNAKRLDLDQRIKILEADPGGASPVNGDGPGGKPEPSHQSSTTQTITSATPFLQRMLPGFSECEVRQ